MSPLTSPSTCTLQKKHTASPMGLPAATLMLLPNWTMSRSAWAGVAATARAAASRKAKRARRIVMRSYLIVRRAGWESSRRISLIRDLFNTGSASAPVPSATTPRTDAEAWVTGAAGSGAKMLAKDERGKRKRIEDSARLRAGKPMTNISRQCNVKQENRSEERRVGKEWRSRWY